MTISIGSLSDQINQKITNTATSELEMVQLLASVNNIEETITTVATAQSLPPAVLNLGKLVYVSDQESYFYSNGVDWSQDFSSTQKILNLIWGWGGSAAGIVGDGTTFSRSSPVSVIGGSGDWSRVWDNSNAGHSIAIKTDCTLWAWGVNSTGQLGDGTTVNKSSPIQVCSGAIKWLSASVGQSHSAGISNNNELWTWGIGSSGQLGDNLASGLSRLSPGSVVGGFTDWTGVSLGWEFSTAVRSNGTLWTWGVNSCGRLGDGTIINRSSPVQVCGGFTDWCQVSAGSCHVAAVRTNGTLWTWGLNTNGRLGDGTVLAKSSPVSVIGGFTDWCQASAGDRHTMGIRTNGSLWGWGYNGSGRLGDGTITSRVSPVSVVGGFTDWCQVNATLNHTVAVRANGTLWAWGSNTSGQLGDCTITNRSSPVSPVGGLSNWCNVSAGGTVTHGIQTSTSGF